MQRNSDPYVSHLMAVAALVLEAGGDEEEAIAALLHDVVEDTSPTVQDVTDQFGPRVASIVESFTDAYTKPKPDWCYRKKKYIAHLLDRTTDRSALLVAAADKLHNARALLRDLGEQGPGSWTRFNVGPECQRWYYRTLAQLFREGLSGPLAEKFQEVVDELFPNED